MIRNNNIKKAVKICGGLSAMSKILGLASPTVHQWITGRRPVPIERCVAIEVATGGAVTRQDLRPDDWWKIWPELADGITRPVPEVEADDVAAMSAAGVDEIARAMGRRRGCGAKAQARPRATSGKANSRRKG